MTETHISKAAGKLLLLPNLVDLDGGDLTSLPVAVQENVQKIDGLIAESEKGARYFLRRFVFAHPKTFRDVPIGLINEHTQEKELQDLLQPLIKGETWGLISDCGLPCLADPGATFVRLSRERGIAVRTFAGPSSIVMALMLSGYSGQRFTFHGYLERDLDQLVKQIHKIQKSAVEEKSTQIFIETPYRNQKLFKILLSHLSNKILLCSAWDVGMPTEQVQSHSVEVWKKLPEPDFHKKPAVFLIS